MITGFVYRSAGLALLWLLLGGGAPGSWVVGVPAILLALFVGARYAPLRRGRVRWRAVPGFAAFMVSEMVRGAALTVRLVLAPPQRLRPGFVTLPLGASDATARALLTNAVNLVPGTVSVTCEGDHLTIHALDLGLPVEAELRHLESRVARLFREAA